MRLWRALVRRVRCIFCHHPDVVREHVDGVWYVVCECGYRVPLIRRDKSDATRVPVNRG